MNRKTFLISTNNQNYIKYADRVLYLEEGSLRFNGSYKEFEKSEEYKIYQFNIKLEETKEVNP